MSPLESNVSRWVAFLLLPLAAIAGGFIAVKAKQWFGYDLDPAEATAYIVSVIGSITAGILLWIRNRGKQELAERTGIDEETLELIATAVLSRLPQAPQVPPPGTSGAPAQPQAPPDMPPDRPRGGTRRTDPGGQRESRPGT